MVFFPLVLGPFVALFLLVAAPYAEPPADPRGFEGVLPPASASASARDDEDPREGRE